MKKLYFLLVLVFVLFAFNNAEQPKKQLKFTLPKGVSKADYLPNTIIVKYKDGTRLNAITESVSSELKDVGIILSALEPIFKTNKNAVESVSGNFHFENYFEAKYTGNAPIETVINALLQNDQIAYAEPSYIHTTWYTPNDAAYGTQFYLSQVKAPQAWDVLRNASNVIIGIVDSGSELTHQDLAANIYYNTADPVNGIDDDGDGYIDNYAGWDFCGASVTTMIGDNDPNVKSAGADHGVHVSGIAGAVTNNGIGVASVATNAKLLIVKAGADDNGRTIFKGYEGIKYAADKGAQIINCSWGGEGGGQFGQEMVNYAISKGCLVVAAAGNAGNDTPIFPAAFDGVLAVANLNSNDTKGSASNYGTYVDISAPGEGIYNTVFNNSYAYYSGTSMAAPLVSSAAALLKAKYPNYTGMQIGELLKATADNINAQNPNYVNLLGKGRLNVFRALTENATAVRYQNISITDQGFGNRAPGTEITMKIALKNFLSPVAGLKLNVTSSSPYVQVLDQNVDVGDFSTAELKSNIAPVRVKILADAPENHEVVFNLRYTGNSGTYTDFEVFKTAVALDYINITVNKIKTTLTSNGRVGFSKANATAGLGFIYNNENMLFEAALLVAKSSTQVMNNARVSSTSNEDFKRTKTAAMSVSNIAAFEGTSVFTDEAAANPIGLRITARALAFDSFADDKYVIMEYELTNTSGADLHNIYTGLFTDWDLDESSANATAYNAATEMAYVYAKKNASHPYAGVKLLNLSAAPAYYPLAYDSPNSLIADNSFSIAEKYQTLTSGIQAQGLGQDIANGYDVMFTLGSGPYNISKGGSIKVAYAFLVADDKNELIAVSEAAKTKYDVVNIKPISELPKDYALKQNYPNSANKFTYIPVDLPENIDMELSIYDIQGRKMATVASGAFGAGAYRFYVDLSRLAKGTYVYRLSTAKFKQSKKMVVR
ncbi:S8 family serine peptidase [Pedobacter sp.]